jgi:hypothetical protein
MDALSVRHQGHASCAESVIGVGEFGEGPVDVRQRQAGEQPRTGADGPAPPPRRTACYLGTHGQCRHGKAKAPPRVVPIRFDVCACHISARAGQQPGAYRRASWSRDVIYRSASIAARNEERGAPGRATGLLVGDLSAGRRGRDSGRPPNTQSLPLGCSRERSSCVSRHNGVHRPKFALATVTTLCDRTTGQPSC